MKFSPSQVFPCSSFDRGICRSCDYLDLPYELGLQEKQKKLEQIFCVAGRDSATLPLQPFVLSPQLRQSRNKAKIAVTGSIARPVLGLVDRDYRGRELLDCPLHLPDINALLRELKNLIPQFQLAPYQIVARTGELKFFLIHQSEETQEMMLRFVLRSRLLENKIQQMIPHLQKKFPQLKVISLNIQPIPQAIIEGPEEIVLTTDSFLRHQFGPYHLHVSPRSFFQTNSQVALMLYQTVAQMIEKWRPRLVLDLYCGVGAFSFFSSAWAEKVFGVEISREAIACARQSQRENGIANVEFFDQSVEEFLQENKIDPDVIITNPPRGGLKEQTLELLLQLSPRFLIYSSCNPQTLARDLEILRPYYLEKSFTPFDMFPLTKHSEVLVFLERKI